MTLCWGAWRPVFSAQTLSRRLSQTISLHCPSLHARSSLLADFCRVHLTCRSLFKMGVEPCRLERFGDLKTQNSTLREAKVIGKVSGDFRQQMNREIFHFSFGLRCHNILLVEIHSLFPLTLQAQVIVEVRNGFKISQEKSLHLIQTYSLFSSPPFAASSLNFYLMLGYFIDSSYCCNRFSFCSNCI